MKYLINYGNKVASFPESAIDAIQRAGECDLKVLLVLCSSGGKTDIKKLVKLSAYSEEQIKESISFWRGVGVIELCDEADIVEENKPAKSDADVKAEANVSEKPIENSPKKLRSSDELPRYTSDELSDVLEENPETATLIDECQRIMGKVFNVREINVIIGFIDYLGLDCEYIMMLLTYCISVGKKSMHYAEKTAFGFYDDGITTSEQLAYELRRREAQQAAEGKIRSMFGVGDRAFTTKEKKFISSWINDMNYSVEIIGKAYEVTADATGKGSFAYANSVLERWNAANLRTIKEIEESYKKEDVKNGSFNTDSFFEAAVKRSLGGN